MQCYILLENEQDVFDAKLICIRFDLKLYFSWEEMNAGTETLGSLSEFTVEKMPMHKT